MHTVYQILHVDRQVNLLPTKEKGPLKKRIISLNTNVQDCLHAYTYHYICPSCRKYLL